MALIRFGNSAVNAEMIEAIHVGVDRHGSDRPDEVTLYMRSGKVFELHGDDARDLAAYVKTFEPPPSQRGSPPAVEP